MPWTPLYKERGQGGERGGNYSRPWPVYMVLYKVLCNKHVAPHRVWHKYWKWKELTNFSFYIPWVTCTSVKVMEMTGLVWCPCVGADDISSSLSFSCLLRVFGMSLWEGKSLSLTSETAYLNCNMCVEPVKGISDPSSCTAALTCGLSKVSSYGFFLNLLSCRKLQATSMNQVRYGIADSVPNTSSQPKSLSVPLFAEPGRDSNLMHLVSTQGRC